MKCYRPISVLPLLSKVLQGHVFDALYEFLISNNLSHQQSGFCNHHSCQSLLIKVTDYLLDSKDKGKVSGLTMIDLRKAFHLVDHPTLLLKLSLYGLDNKALSWFHLYLINREFQVAFDSQFSNKST